VSVEEMNPSIYYVLNHYGMNIFVYNEYWEYQRTISFSYSPSYSINNNGSKYVTTDSSIYKYDKYLTLTKQTDSCFINRGIYYNSFNRFIYAACMFSRYIIELDENLTTIRMLTTVYQPWFITGYNGQMVVGDNDNGTVYFYQNDLIVQTISTQCTGRVSSILFDSYNHMLVLCESNNYLFIYDLFGTFTGISFSTCFKPASMNFDLKGRLVITCMNQIDIYY
jgi:hypothetical protein